jgi:DNA-binding transcriptional LysR family regulator
MVLGSFNLKKRSMMALDVRQLRAFVTLADDLHFGRAADRLDIAQSALSTQIKRIEDIIGGRLFDRGRRSAVRLTAAAELFLLEARQSLEQLDRTERIGRLAMRGVAGPASIGYVFSAAMSGILARALAAVRRDLPDAVPQASPMETPEQIAAVADVLLDAGFIRPRATYPAGISAKIIERKAMILAIAEGHPLAAKRKIRARDLAAERFIIPQSGGDGGMRAPVAALATNGGFVIDSAINTGDFVTAATIAAAGYGLVLAPLSLKNLTIPGISYREIEDYSGTVDLALIWRGPRSPLIATILAALE